MEFARVARVPRPGEIAHVAGTFTEPAGGGAVAAVQMRKLAGEAVFLTALGDDDLGRRAAAGLRAGHGVELHAAWREEPQRRAFTFLDDAAERTITVIGDRLAPARADSLPWDRLAALDAVYFTAGDADALRAARAARVLVATPRALPTLLQAGVALDVLVASANDAGEAYAAGQLDPEPHWVVRTHGAQGGEWVGSEGRTGDWRAVAPTAEPADSYGCGDSFAAGLTYALGAGLEIGDALELAARCGAACLTGRGPYAGQLEL